MASLHWQVKICENQKLFFKPFFRNDTLVLVACLRYVWTKNINYLEISAVVAKLTAANLLSAVLFGQKTEFIQRIKNIFLIKSSYISTNSTKSLLKNINCQLFSFAGSEC